MNKINEIGDTKKGQEMLGRTAERAYQRAQRTSGADKKRYMRTYNDAYKTGGKSSNKHLGGSREHFDNGRDYEYEKWADEHNGNVAESKNMNKKLIRLTESDLHKIVKESVNRIMEEYYPINSNDFTKDYRFAANGFANNSANMPSPEYDDIAPYSKNIGDYYAAPYRDSDQMYRDNVEFNRREHNKQAAADRRWMKAADSRPLYRKNSPNNDIPR